MRLHLIAIASVVAACHAAPETGAPDGPASSRDAPADGSDSGSGPGSSSGYVHVADGAIVDGTGAALAMHCVNLGGWLEPEGYLIGSALEGLVKSPTQIRAGLVALVGQTEADAFWQQWEAAYITQADFTRIAALGFNCVRLPVTASRLGDVDGATVTLDATEIQPIDNAVAWGAASHVYVVLDLHEAYGGANFAPTSGGVPSTDTFPQLWVGSNGEYPSATAAANKQLTIQLWSLLAARYATATSIAGYDLVNEPELDDMNKPSQSPVPQSDLVALFTSVIAEIRAADPNHLLFIEGDALATDFTPFSAPLDPNSAYEFHAYDLSSASPWLDPTATPSAIDPLVTLSQAQHVPLWMGEFGENTLTWQQEMVALAGSHEVGWAVWPWKRRETFATHPVAETIVVPASWEPVFSYMVGATTTAPADPEAGMAAMLAALPLANCTEDASLAATLVAD